MTSLKKFFFDRQDRELLTVVNKVITTPARDRMEQRIFDINLHPHGIRTQAVSREIRVATAVVQLLGSLEDGQIQDRLLALRILFDEALNSAQTSLRRNTARVLIQIMKDMVRAHGDERAQIKLAHDFRRAATGNPMIVRRLLARYHLVEMPEDWSQLAFDHHVHDANTKGRKNPTHLIMDAWIKGIKYLTVIYYNFVDYEAARELLSAAEIMDIDVRVGIEFSSPFRGRYVHFIWVPRGFSDAEGFLEFLTEPPVRHLMERGRAASEWQQRYVFRALQRWNEVHRNTIALEIETDIPEVSEEEFKIFVGKGQASLLHLAECIYKKILPTLTARATELQAMLEQAGDDAEAVNKLKIRMAALDIMDSSLILDSWLSPEMNPDIPSPEVPPEDEHDEDVPDILRHSPMVMLNWLASLNVGYRISLNLANLGPEDVLELLWLCQGLITHIELFNLKEWHEGKLARLEEINRLQLAINRGSAPRLKRLIRDMIKGIEQECVTSGDDERCILFRDILRNLPILQGFYKKVPLRVRVGTDSTSRSHRTLGMGIVFPETLTPRGRKFFKSPQASKVKIPIHTEVAMNVSYRSSPHDRFGPGLTSFIRKLPFCKYFGYTREQKWVSRSPVSRITENGNMAPLGGQVMAGHKHLLQDLRGKKRPKESFPGFFYLNTKLNNALKVLLGFIPAMCAFQYTQSWWFLAWFGPIIWFGITGFRNIVQSIMAGGGFHRSTLLRWNDYVSWSRLCDSLMYTGFSVLLLELGMRMLLLEKTMGFTVGNHPFMVYTIIAAANGVYISSHNIIRGLPFEAVIGNLFRSALAIPVSVAYNQIILDGLSMMGMVDPLAFIQPGAAIISKAASDTVAALIEGFADRRNNLRMRRWDYQTKLQQIFETYSRLEIRFPEEDMLKLLARPKKFFRKMEEEKDKLELELIINALDLMHFWLYQPRAQDVLKAIVRDMSEEERVILSRLQLVLVHESKVSRLFVDGLVGRNFSRPLAFYLDKREDYLRAVMRLCNVTHREE